MTALRIASLIGIASLATAVPVSAQRPIVSPRIVHVDGNAVRVMTFGLDGRSRRERRRVFVDYWLTPPEERPIPPNLDLPTAVVLGTYVGDMPEAERPARAAFHEQRADGIRSWFSDVRQLHWRVAPHAGHFVQGDDPMLVAAAVRQVLDWVEAAR